MRPKRLLTIAMMWITVVFVGVNLCFGQSYWEKSYGGSVNNCISAIQSTDDGNFLMVGWTENSVIGGWIVKIKPNGDTIWTKKYTDEVFYSIQPCGDGNFLLAGYNQFDIMNGWDRLLVKIKPNGDTIWTKTYGGIWNDEISTIQPTIDGNLLLAGLTDSGDGWLLKIRPNGDTIWTKTYKTWNVGSFYVLQPTSDSNFLLAGYTHFNIMNGDNGFLVKIKPNGDTIWSKTYSEAGSFISVQPTENGNFLLAGYTPDPCCGLLVKIKPNGDTIWTKTYCRTDHELFHSIQPTGDGDFLLAGYTQSIDKGNECCGWLLKIKPNGDTIWTKAFDGADCFEFNTINPTSDGNFLVAGRGSVSVTCIIADQYAYKGSLFTYKIPTYSTDTLNFGYVPLKVPSGMTVSTGGTVSWTPKNDSVYMDHAEFLVFNDMGRKDTLTFNVFVNADYQKPVLTRPSQISKAASMPFDIAATSLPGHVEFLLPPSAVSLCIYDITGRLVDKIVTATSPSGTCIVWPGNQSSNSKIHAGKYFAKASTGKNSTVKPFVLVR